MTLKENHISGDGLSEAVCRQRGDTVTKSGNSLTQELETYPNRLPEWTDSEGVFVRGRFSEVCGFHEEFVKAVTAGYMRFRIMPFLA